MGSKRRLAPALVKIRVGVTATVTSKPKNVNICISTSLATGLQTFLSNLTWLKVHASVLHDGDVKLVENAHDDSLTSGGADNIIIRLSINKELQTIGQAVLCKWNHSPNEKKLLLITQS